MRLTLPGGAKDVADLAPRQEGAALFAGVLAAQGGHGVRWEDEASAAQAPAPEL